MIVKTCLPSILAGPCAVVISDQQSLGLLQRGLVLAKKAHKGFWKGLARRR